MPDTRINFEAVVPIVPAGPDMVAALAFYEGKLGFARRSTGDPSGTEVIGRGAVQLLLQKTDDAYWASQTTIRVRVNDVEALYAEVQAQGLDKITGIMSQPGGAAAS